MIINGREQTAWGYIGELEWDMFVKYDGRAFKYTRASNLRKMYSQGVWYKGTLFSGDYLTKSAKRTIDSEFYKIEQKLQK